VRCLDRGARLQDRFLDGRRLFTIKNICCSGARPCSNDKNVKIKACFITNTGKIRTHNEDSILLGDLVISETSMTEPGCREYEGEQALFMVADGMGGQRRGEAASRAVLEVFRERSGELIGTEDILTTTGGAKRKLDEMARADKTARGLGTTVAGILFRFGRATIFNCGDSRVYRLDGRHLRRVSKDHSLVQELVDKGMLAERDMRVHPQKNIITAAITGDLEDGAPAVSVRDLKISGRQIFLLCTDGLWESMDTRDMAGCFSGAGPEAAVRCLFSKAMDTRAGDNISIVVLEVGGLPSGEVV
jgi:serine/threonine protein phosphatase PrpC